MKNIIDFTRINNDINGNPRYVCHFLEFITDKDREETDISQRYELALSKARDLGGKKFHNKQYGGGILFQSYNLRDLEDSILVMTGRAIECHRQPTPYEIKKGYGAIHRRTFLTSELLNKSGKLKKWLKADDGLNYSIPQ